VPTILDSNGFRFIIWPADHEPPHVHVFKGKGETGSTPGLAGASNKDLADGRILGNGFGLHREKLDADLSIPSLAVGIFGSKARRREIARRGGASISPAKATAARANGAKGGRPRKST